MRDLICLGWLDEDMIVGINWTLGDCLVERVCVCFDGDDLSGRQVGGSASGGACQ